MLFTDLNVPSGNVDMSRANCAAIGTILDSTDDPALGKHKSACCAGCQWGDTDIVRRHASPPHVYRDDIALAHM